MFIAVRASVPRYRYDQLMYLGWKVFLPLTLGLLLVLVSLLLLNNNNLLNDNIGIIQNSIFFMSIDSFLKVFVISGFVLVFLIGRYLSYRKINNITILSYVLISVISLTSARILLKLNETGVFDWFLFIYIILGFIIIIYLYIKKSRSVEVGINDTNLSEVLQFNYFSTLINFNLHVVLSLVSTYNDVFKKIEKYMPKFYIKLNNTINLDAWAFFFLMLHHMLLWFYQLFLYQIAFLALLLLLLYTFNWIFIAIFCLFNREYVRERFSFHMEVYFTKNVLNPFYVQFYKHSRTMMLVKKLAPYVPSLVGAATAIGTAVLVKQNNDLIKQNERIIEYQKRADKRDEERLVLEERSTRAQEDSNQISREGNELWRESNRISIGSSGQSGST